MDLNFVLCLKLYDFISFYHPNVPIVLTKAASTTSTRPYIMQSFGVRNEFCID